MQDIAVSADHAALWRRLATRVAQLRRRLPTSAAIPELSPASAWLRKLEQDVSPTTAGRSIRTACLTQDSYAQDTASRARALLLASAGSALLTGAPTKKMDTDPQVPAPGADSSGKE